MKQKKNSMMPVILIAAGMIAVAAFVIGLSIWTEQRNSAGGQAGGDAVSSTAAGTREDQAADGAPVDYAKTGDLVLGTYEGIEIDPEPADSDVLEEMEADLKKMSKDHKGKIREGDYICIDQEGSIQGEVYEGLTEDDLVLRVGDNEYGEKLEKKLVGRQPGDTFTVSEVMGDEYEELSGETVDYRITVKGRFDDYYADQFSKGAYPSVKKYVAHVRETLKKKNESASEAGAEAWDTFVEECDVSRIPDSLQQMLEEEIENTKQQYRNYAEMEGITYEEAMEAFGQDEDSLAEIAEETVEGRMIAKTVAAKENLVLEDAQYKQYLTETMMDSEDGESEKERTLEELEEEYKRDYGSRPKDDMLILLVQSFIGSRVKLI